MKHCCVIGGTGFIGYWLVRALLLKEKQVTVIGRSQIPSRSLPEGVQYFHGDCADKKFLMNVLKNVDVVISLVYSTVPKTSFEDPVHDIVSNLPFAVTLFEVASTLPLNKLVLVSSGGTVYGKAQHLPIREYHPTNPISPYGITKLAIEKYAMMFHEVKGLPVVCVRPSNAYGEGQKPFIGQGFVATAIVSILKRKKVILYGEAGTIRDYIHVTDVANGIVAALEQGKPGMTYNIGSGIGKSNKEVFNAILPFADTAKLEVQTEILPPRKFDVPINVLDCEKLIHESGWKIHIPFEEGVRRTWNWFYNEEHALNQIPESHRYQNENSPYS